MNKILQIAGVFALAITCAQAQRSTVAIELDHPAIAYGIKTASDPITELRQSIEQGEVQLRFNEHTGYLRSLLDALHIPVESQIAVFSKTSLQAPLIHPHNPRMIYFNDSISVAWMRGGFIEIAVHDPRQGATFYVLQQLATDKPRLQSDNRCNTCHRSQASLGVPGFLIRSIPTAFDGTILPWLGNYITNHNSPVDERWGGWYVTGQAGSPKHLGNGPIGDKRAADLTSAAAPVLENLKPRLDASLYLTPHSDVVALLVFEHQMHMINLLTRIGWEARIASHDKLEPGTLDSTVDEAVDYMLFVDEAPLGSVRGTSGFVEKFSAQGPTDEKGRSLRQLRLNQRLMEYPCSYMIYTQAFDSLPMEARNAIYARLWRILSGEIQEPRYARLSRADRQSITEILRETKQGLPAYFQVGAATR